MRRELLMGCGMSRDKRVTIEAISPEWSNLTTLDFLESAKPDVLHDLNVLPYPFEDNSFDEIHAYEVLEHCGSQGDGEFFFGQFAEIYRILKPGGFFCATVPMWDQPMAWGAPDHKRVLPPEVFVFLDPQYYEHNLGKPHSTAADYRHWLGSTHLEMIAHQEKGGSLGIVLRAVK